MKKIDIFLFIFLSCSSILSATTVYEDGEDGTANGWRVQKNGEPAKNIYSPARDSQVIRLEGKGGPWILGAVSGDLAWNNTREKTISWKMVQGSRYTVYIPVTTKNGTRYLFYNDLPKRILRHGFEGGILHGLGGYNHSEYKNVWRTYTRNLERDLKDSEPDNELISVNGFIYAGANVSIDDILLYNPTEHVYSDGSNVGDWVVSDNDPAGARISRVIDPQGDHAQGDVIQLQGDGLNNKYRLNPENWNNTTQSIIQWRSRFYETYSVSIKVQTRLGERELLYTNSNNYYPSGGVINEGHTIWHEMGGRSLIGVNGWEQERDFGSVNDFWQTVTRDLKQDLRDFEPDNELISVNSFEVMGSGLIDDVKMLDRPVVIDPKKDMVYEDAEDGTIDGWHVYDNDPAGATITNVIDATKGRVIELKGDGIANGYEIGARRGDGQWNNRNHKAISWSMNYSENFSIYVALETTNGPRYMNYERRDDDRGKSGNYLKFGLGSNIADGSWHTINRNLEDDLHQFEPDNDILAIHAFLVRGSGRLDDIKTMLTYHKTVYEDAEDGTTNRWTVYANSSANAVINNILDNNRGSRVIQLQGQGLADGYRLRDAQNHIWSDTTHKNIKWSMNYSEPFTLYIETQTKNGTRYLVYTARDDDRGLSGSYIRLGVGADIIDGSWHTIERDIAQDIANAEAGNELISINSFMIRGSGLIDDVEAF
ncbi:MAG: hypothetical protein GXO60_09260 [Epsilonproteobacteria bacterium]|nr:hypothetical protein [Campylobacterota bacterium]